MNRPEARRREVLHTFEQVLSVKATEPEALGEALTRLVERVHRTWPGVLLSDSAFFEHLDRHGMLRPLLQDSEHAERIRADELYLCAACAQGIPAAHAQFETHYLAPSARSVRRIDAAPAFAEDVLQALREKLFLPAEDRLPKVADYSGAGALDRWVAAAAVRTALNLKTRGGQETPVEENEWDALPSVQGGAELAVMRTRFHAEFSDAFQAALAKLTAEERNLLRLHLLERVSIDRLAVMFQTHRSTAARWIVKARERLAELTEEGLAERLKISRAELSELMHLVRSQLDLSIHRFLLKTDS